MIEWITIVSEWLKQLPWVCFTILVIILYVRNQMDKLREKLHEIDKKLIKMGDMIKDLARSIRGLINFNETLLTILYKRNTITKIELEALTKYLEDLKPKAHSKYYTKEVEKQLGQILSKIRRNLNSLTWEDVKQLEKIYELLMKEANASNRDELAEYAGSLKVLIGLCRAYLLFDKNEPPPPPIKIPTKPKQQDKNNLKTRKK